MIKKLFDGRPEARARPDIAKATAKFAKVVDENRLIQGTAKRTADKRGRGFRRCIDRLIHCSDFRDRDATVECI